MKIEYLGKDGRTAINRRLGPVEVGRHYELPDAAGRNLIRTGHFAEVGSAPKKSKKAAAKVAKP